MSCAGLSGAQRGPWVRCGAAVAAQGRVPLSSAALGSVQVMWEQSLEVMVSPAGRQHLEHSSSRNVGSKHDVQEAPHPPVPVRALGALVMPLPGALHHHGTA